MTRYNSLSPNEPDSSGIPTPARFTAFAILQEGKTTVFFALILDSLGSTELLFILVVALIFFGPRKLPQLAKSMGKGLAEFRKASDDFKRTWEREVALESARAEDNSLLESQPAAVYEPVAATQPIIETTASELAVPREAQSQTFSEALADTPPEPIEIPAEAAKTETRPVRKQDWL
jgi:TatA/E family protein of Tat protein translocase